MIEPYYEKIFGLTSINSDKVEIKLPLQNGGFWKREYNKSDLIQKIINDFKEENNEDFPEECMAYMKKKKESFKMNNEIGILLTNKEKSDLMFSKGKNDKTYHNIVLGEEKIPELIGKPFSEPFEVVVFHKNKKILKIQKYDQKIVNEEGLNNYGSSSTYCNGDNKIFISGGEKRNGNFVEKFWKINLENQEIETFPMAQKKIIV